jgi:hypothetical protein
MMVHVLVVVVGGNGVNGTCQRSLVAASLHDVCAWHSRKPWPITKDGYHIDQTAVSPCSRTITPLAALDMLTSCPAVAMQPHVAFSALAFFMSRRFRW